VVNLCSQLLVALSIWELSKNNDAGKYFTLFVYQTILAFFIPHFLSRFLSTWFAMLLLFACFAELGVYNISITLASALFVIVWLKDTQWGDKTSLWSPIAYGLAFSLLQFNGFLFFAGEIHSFFHGSASAWVNHLSYWFSKIIIGVLFIYLTQYVRQQLHITLKSNAGYLITASGVGLIIIDYFIPGLSGALLLLSIGLIKQRRLLISLGIAAFLSFISWYYYLLHISLLNKSIILMAFGFSFALIYLIINKATTKNLSINQHIKPITFTQWFSFGMLLFILALVNFNIYQKEDILKNGQIILLKLAPKDPRSLMQGDYMRLRFAIENSLLKTIDANNNALNQYAVVTLDKNQVATFSYLFDQKPLQKQQVKIQFRLRQHKIRLATHAFFFEEGTAQLYNSAQYGEFRVDKNGKMLLNNLRDKDFKILGYNQP